VFYSWDERRNKLFWSTSALASFFDAIARRGRRYYLPDPLKSSNQVQARLQGISDLFTKGFGQITSTRAEINLFLRTENFTRNPLITGNWAVGHLNPISINKRASILFSKHIEGNRIPLFGSGKDFGSSTDWFSTEIPFLENKEKFIWSATLPGH